MPLLDRQQAFGYTQEDTKFLMTPMAVNGEEPIGSMGNDSPLAASRARTKRCITTSSSCLRRSRIRRLIRYGEELVTSLVSFIGPKPNLLGIDELNPPLRLEVSQPVLDFYEMEKIRILIATPRASSDPMSSTFVIRSHGANKQSRHDLLRFARKQKTPYAAAFRY